MLTPIILNTKPAQPNWKWPTTWQVEPSNQRQPDEENPKAAPATLASRRQTPPTARNISTPTPLVKEDKLPMGWSAGVVFLLVPSVPHVSYVLHVPHVPHVSPVPPVPPELIK